MADLGQRGATCTQEAGRFCATGYRTFQALRLRLSYPRRVLHKQGGGALSQGPCTRSQDRRHEEA